MRPDPPPLSDLPRISPAWDSSAENRDDLSFRDDDSLLSSSSSDCSQRVFERVKRELERSWGESCSSEGAKRPAVVEDYLRDVEEAALDEDRLNDLFAWEADLRQRSGVPQELAQVEARAHAFLVEIRRRKRTARELESSIREMLKNAPAPLKPGTRESPDDCGELPAMLARLAPFSQLPPRVCEEIALHAVEAAFVPGQVLLRQGEASDCLVVLLSGSVEISVLDRDRSHVIATLDERTVIGELGMLTNEPRSGSVTAITEGRLAVIAREKFAHLISAHPALSIAFSELIAKRVGTSSIDVLCGKTIQGYKLHRRIGRGGMGIVYAALDIAANEERAVKMLRHDLAYDRCSLRRFHQEAAIVKSLRHPNIVRMYDEFSAYGTCFVAMELCQGMSLATAVERFSPLPTGVIRSLVGQLAEALRHTHAAGVAHRDIKPSNIMVLYDGQVKLTDFGLARSPMTFEGDLTSHGQVMGTPHYMSPEQLLGERGDGRSDLYSLGLVLYELLSGVPTFVGATFRELVKERSRWQLPAAEQIGGGLDPDLYEFLQECLAEEPEGRTADLNRAAAWSAPIDWEFAGSLNGLAAMADEGVGGRPAEPIVAVQARP